MSVSDDAFDPRFSEKFDEIPCNGNINEFCAAGGYRQNSTLFSSTVIAQVLDSFFLNRISAISLVLF